MEWILKKVLEKVSVKKLADMAWRAIKPKLEKLVNDTETTFDNEALEIISSVVEGLISEIKA